MVWRGLLHPVVYYDSAYHQQVFTDLKAAISAGGIVALTGVVGSGKTVLLARMQHHLREGGQIEVCESLVFDVQRVTLSTLKLECVPPFTHDVCVRVVQLALPPVLREPRDVKPTPPSEPACRPSCRTSVLFLADM